MASHLSLLLGALLAAFVLDRLLLRAEGRGWIYYRRRKPSRRRLGTAFLELHAQLEPEKRYVLEERRALRVEEEDHAGPGDPRPRS